MGELGDGTWFKVGSGTDGNKVVAFAIANPLDGLIP
jgi:hypothetical protein|tara:strand:- start:1048 stop:1155 length:108 start_codon:yes stop_codon:yes gene_type:complete